MTAPSVPTPSEVLGARCQAHPERIARGTCSRCGAFFCWEDRSIVQEREYCAPCGQRPDINYLKVFRQQCWGKRDMWGWFIGVMGLLCLVSGLHTLILTERAWPIAGPLWIAWGVVGLCFWWGLKPARIALVVVSTLTLLLSTLAIGLPGFAMVFIPWVSTLVVFSNARTKLFFREELSEQALVRLWELQKNNAPARHGFLLSLLGLLLPFLSPLSLVLSLVGLSRVDPHATPPVGRKKQAIAGTVLSLAGLAWGTAYYFL